MSEATLSDDLTFWQKLVEPPRSVDDQERRRRARILAGLTLALLACDLLLMGWALLVRGGVHYSALAMAGLFFVSYLLSRTRLPEWGARLLVFGAAGMTFVFLATFPNLSIMIQALPLVLLPILVSTILLRARSTISLSILTVIALTIFSTTAPWLDLAQIAGLFAVIALTSVLAAAASLIRERDLEMIQKQAADLNRYSEALAGQVDQRTRNILATAEVGRAITGARDLDVLLKQVVKLIIERFEFYHAQVFLVDENGQYAVLKESTGPTGQELLRRGHKLAVGSQSVIGQVTARGEAVVASDTDKNPMHRHNELLPHTRAEMALPLRVGGRVIGALDVQSVNPEAFDPTDIPVFQTMADQLAVAIDNARLFEQARRNLHDIEQLNQQLTGEAWRTFVTGRGARAPVGYVGDSDGVRPVGVGEVEKVSEPVEGAISLPLTVRGKTIGVMDVKPRSGEAPDEEVQIMLEAVAERVALALDNTRLGEEARSQAEREQLLSDLSAELQRTTDMDVILRVTARELSRVLDAPHAFVHLTQPGAHSGSGDGAT